MRKLEHWKDSTAKAIQKVQRPAYQVEAALMGFHDIPQLKESVLEIRNSSEIFWGFVEEERLLGFISYKKEQNTIDIHRLVVSPNHFRKGIGRKLLAFMLEEFQGLEFIVSTGKANVPAKNLYASFGFIEEKDFEVAPGILCTALKKES